MASGGALDLFVLILILSGVLSLVLGGVALYLWLPSRRDAAARAALGDALLTGAVVSLAVFLFQVVIEERFSEIEGRRAQEQAVQNLKLQVAVQSELEGFDFRGVRSRDLHDLSRFYFRGKRLADADFRGLTLNDANFTGAQLPRAKLDGATLHGAELIAANLEGAFLIGTQLQRADLTSACMRGATLTGADLTAADLTGTDLSDAQYDETTVWTNGETRECDVPPCAVRARRPGAPTTCPA